MQQTERFWERKSLDELSDREWEALCDGCGKCCLVKLEDEADGRLHFTSAICRFYDRQACRCTVYAERTAKAADCLSLSSRTVLETRGLPVSCAYWLVADGQPLPDWHHLVCRDRDRVHRERHSVYGWVISEDDVHQDQLEEMVIRWVE